VRAPHSLTFAGRNGMRAKVPERPSLAAERVRFVGEPLALVVAESVLAAQDAAELIEIDVYIGASMPQTCISKFP
jgi:aerobic carbon-monoxide dehydrogenase large subunit